MRITGSRSRAIVGELTTATQVAWESGWRPKVGPSHRFWCLAGCGASLYSRDPEVYSFTCLACREEAATYAARSAKNIKARRRLQAEADG